MAANYVVFIYVIILLVGRSIWKQYHVYRYGRFLVGDAKTFCAQGANLWDRLRTMTDYRDESYIACRIYGTEFEAHGSTTTAASPQSYRFELTAEEKWPHVMFDHILTDKNDRNHGTCQRIASDFMIYIETSTWLRKGQRSHSNPKVPA